MYKSILVLPDGSEISSGAGTDSAIRSVTLTESVNGSGDLAPGAVCAACLEFELWAPNGALRLTAGDRLIYCREADGLRSQVGVFWAEQPVRSSAHVYKVTAYDAVLQLDRDLSPWLWTGQDSFPMCLHAFAAAVCAQCGVTADTEGLPNGDYPVQPFYADGLTGRQLLQWAAQAAGRFVRARPDGTLEFAWYAAKDVVVQPAAAPQVLLLAADSDGAALTDADGLSLQLDDGEPDRLAYYMGGLSYEDHVCAPPVKVQLCQSGSDVGVICPADETGTNAYVVQGNLLLTTGSDEALRPVAEHLYALMKDLAYTPARVELPHTDLLRAGDLYTIVTADGRTLTGCVMTRTTRGGRDTLESTGSPSRDSVSAVNRRTYQDLNGRMLELTMGVDGLKTTASELSGRYTALEQTVEGFRLEATEDDETSWLTLKTGETVLSSTDIRLLGCVTFSNLSTPGETAINGANLTTGRIRNADDTTLYDLDGAVLRQGGEQDDHVQMDSTGVYWTLAGAATTGVLRHRNGVSYLGAHSKYINYGWVDGVDPTQYIGMQIEYNSDTDRHANFNVQLDVDNAVSCRSLSAWESKDGIAQTEGFGPLEIAAVESPAPTYVDLGSGVCGEDGLCWLTPDPRYAETVETSAALRWYLTPCAAGAMWVEKTAFGAVVHGAPGQPFDWMCAAPIRGRGLQYAEVATVSPPWRQNEACALLAAVQDDLRIEEEQQCAALLTEGE